METARARAAGVNRGPLNQTIFSDLVSWGASNPEKLDSLYESPHATQCVFRSLPPVARLYVSRVLFLSPNYPKFSPALFRSALLRRTRATDRHESALKTLRALRVFVDAEACAESLDGSQALDGQSALLSLNPTFASQLRNTVTCSVAPVFGGNLTSTSERTVDELDLFSGSRLERILCFSIENSDSVPDPSPEMQRALASTGILCPVDGGRLMTISSIGFQFLLRDSYSQVWILLRDIVNVRFAGFELDALKLVFQISFARCTKAYSTDPLSQSQLVLIEYLDELGIVALDAQSGSFYPTRLGVNLVASTSRSADSVSSTENQLVAPTVSSSGDIKIIVETNFRLYAYTTSVFQMNLLGLFTQMRYQLPNLVVGHLTREKVRDALVNGISADQIIGFLNSHVHPRVKGGTIPATVRDEIKLWEAEQERVQFFPGFLLRDFTSAVVYEKVLAYANDISACSWSNRPRRQLVVLQAEYENVRKFIRSLS